MCEVDKKTASKIISGGMIKMTICIKPFNEKYFSVQFPNGFDQKMLNVARSIPNRKWNNEKKLWLIPNTKEASQMFLRNLYELGSFNFPIFKNPAPAAFVFLTKQIRWQSCIYATKRLPLSGELAKIY